MDISVSSNSADRDQLKSAKIAVLRLINEHKDILFAGKVSDSISREAKEAKWSEVAVYAHALGAFPSHRSWDYLKDTTWQNWRKRFVEKRDKKEKFDKFGVGTKVVYDEADLLIKEILDALGRNPPSSQTAFSYPSPNNSYSHYRDASEVLEIEFDTKNEEEGDELNNEMYKGNQVIMSEAENGSGSSGSNYSSMNMDSNMDNGDYSENGYDRDDDDAQQYMGKGTNGMATLKREPLKNSKIVSTSSLSSTGSRAALFRKYAFSGYRTGGGSLIRKRPANFLNASGAVARENDVEKELAELKCKKIKAELELLERESYKMDLEILQLERSLGLPASQITKKFYNRANVHRGIPKNP